MVTKQTDYFNFYTEITAWPTLKCLSIGTPNSINFPFVSNGKLMVFRCPNIQACCNEAVLCLTFGTPENNEFSIWDKWKIYYFQVSQYLSTLGYISGHVKAPCLQARHCKLDKSSNMLLFSSALPLTNWFTYKQIMKATS